MDQNVKKKINFESLKNLILNYRTEKIEVDQLKFLRNKDHVNILDSCSYKKILIFWTLKIYSSGELTVQIV